MTYSMTEPTATPGSGARSTRLSLKMSRSSRAGASMIALASSVCTVPSFETTRACTVGRSLYQGAHGTSIVPSPSTAESSTIAEHVPLRRVRLAVRLERVVRLVEQHDESGIARHLLRRRDQLFRIGRKRRRVPRIGRKNDAAAKADHRRENGDTKAKNEVHGVSERKIIRTDRRW